MLQSLRVAMLETQVIKVNVWIVLKYGIRLIWLFTIVNLVNIYDVSLFHEKCCMINVTHRIVYTGLVLITIMNVLYILLIMLLMNASH